MDIPDRVKLLIQRRYATWALDEATGEVTNNYPLLQSFRVGPAHRLWHFLKLLPTEAQHSMLRALTMRRLRLQANSLPLPKPTHEELLLVAKYFDTISLSMTQLEQEQLCYLRQKEPIRWNRSTFAQYIAARLKSVFESDWLEFGGGTFRYESRVGKFKVFTYIDVGGRGRHLSYDHDLISDTGHSAIIGRFSVLSWLGVSGQTDWEELDESQVEEVTSALTRVCAKFMSVCPELIEGLP